MTLHIRYEVVMEQPVPSPVLCPYCRGSGTAPGDGVTECGFCDRGQTISNGVEATKALAGMLADFIAARGLNYRFQVIDRKVMDDTNPSYVHPTELTRGFDDNPDPAHVLYEGLVTLRRRLSR